MDMLTSFFPPAFPALALSHFVALLSPGPDFFLLMGYAIRYRLRRQRRPCASVLPPGTGCTLCWRLSAGAYCVAPLLFTVVELLGAAYLLWIGSLLLRSRPTTLDVRSASASRPSRVKQLLLGLGSSLLNPKNALFYLALMTSLLGPDVTLMQQAVSGVWMTSIVLLWDLLLVTMIALPAVQRRLSTVVWRVERAAGGVLMAFGCWIVWQFLHESAVRLYA